MSSILISLSRSSSRSSSPPGSPRSSFLPRTSMVMILFNIILFCAVYVNQSLVPARALWSLSVQEELMKHQQEDDGNEGQIRLCEDALRFFDRFDLESSIQRSQDFHHRGGSLKQVQLLLDNHIDTTVRKLGLSFLPDENPEDGATQDVTQHLREHFDTHYDSRGGYGRPLPGKYDQRHPLVMEDRYVEVADPIGTRERWDAALGPLGPNCTNLLEIGEPNRDGTKWMCQPLVQEADEEEEECHIISIGGNDNWHFEERVRRDMPHCITHTFDCTLEGGEPRRKPNDNGIRFYNYCIDSHNHTDLHGRHYLTYFDILEKAQLTKPPLLFKLDVEGFEFDIFAHMIQKADDSEALLHQVPLNWWLPQQIIVELHWATRMTGVEWMPRTRTSAEIGLLSNMMFTGGGYQPIFQSWNPGCPSCIEVLYFRTQC